MHPAEHLTGQVDAVRCARLHPVKRAAARAINAGQAQHPRANGLPGQIGLCAGSAPTCANGRGFIDPRPAGIAIDPGGGEIAEPRRGPAAQQITVACQNRIAAIARRGDR